MCFSFQKPSLVLDFIPDPKISVLPELRFTLVLLCPCGLHIPLHHITQIHLFISIRTIRATTDRMKALHLLMNMNRALVRVARFTKQSSQNDELHIIRLESTDRVYLCSIDSFLAKQRFNPFPVKPQTSLVTASYSLVIQF